MFTIMHGHYLKVLQELKVMASGISPSMTQKNTNNVDAGRLSIYRLSYAWINYLQSQSDYVFATCNFSTSFQQDWLLLDVNFTI